MSKQVKINPFLKANNDTGFGTNASDHGGRFVNRDGSFNVRKEGVPFWDRFSIYHSMITWPRWKFLSVIILVYVAFNLAYTAIYWILGVNQFQGMIASTRWGQLKELFYFSTETFTTVGYGRVNPVGDAANLVAALESMNGFLSFALATGLLYGRFSRPKAYLAFSDNALISPYNDITGLMFRLVSYKDNHNLTNLDVKVNLSITIQENGKSASKFYDLPLERSHVDSLPMNWTIVHPIDEKSPLFGLSSEDMRTVDVEIYVLVRAFDDIYSNNVLQRTSYTFQEILFDRKFVPMYRESEDRNTTIVELNKLNAYREMKIPPKASLSQEGSLRLPE